MVPMNLPQYGSRGNTAYPQAELPKAGKVLRVEMCLRAQRAIKAFVDGQNITQIDAAVCAPIYPLLVVNK